MTAQLKPKMMNVLPYRKMIFYPSIGKDIFKDNFKSLLKSSEKKNFFNTNTDDFAIEGSILKDNFKIYRKIEMIKPMYFITYGELLNHDDFEISIEIKPSIIWIILSLIVLGGITIALIIFAKEYLLIILGMALLDYLLIMMAFNFHLMWIEDLFHKELLINKP